MIFPKVLILTVFIFGTFARGTTENVEERFEVLERKLAAYETKDIETNKQFKVIERKFAALTKAFEMEDIDLLNTEVIGTNRGWISNLNSLKSTVSDLATTVASNLNDVKTNAEQIAVSNLKRKS